MTKTLNYGAAVATIAALVFSIFAALPASAFACEHWCGGGSETNTDNSVYINVSNSGSITSNTTASAKTGGNWAGGSEGGDGDDGGNGGNGGNAGGEGEGEYCWECGDYGGDANAGDGGDGGNGGNGGDGGAGGLVDTGDAEANAGSMNVLNTTEIEVEQADCGCEEGGYQHHGWGRRGDRNTDNSVDVHVSNSGAITSNTEAKAKTGYNDAEGSEGGDGDDAGDGGNGGNAEGGSGFWEYGEYFGSASNAGDGGDGGEGGNGGDGDVGGTIRTGRALSNSGSINVMNSTVVRVTR